MDKVKLERLRVKARTDDTLKDILRHYSENSAYSSTIMRSLDAAFRRQKIKHSQGAIRRALGEIALVSGGTVKRDHNKEVLGIYKMAVDTKTLGKAILGDYEAYGDDRTAQTATEARNFSGAAKLVRGSPGDVKIYPARQAGSLSITLTINGKPVSMPLPENLSPEELSALIERLRRTEDK